MAGPNPQALRAIVESLREQAVGEGRERDDLKIFALMSVVPDHTDEKARARYEEYQSYAQPEGALALMSGWSGIDLSAFGLDARVEKVSTQAIQASMEALGTRTVRELGESLAVGGATPVIVGSPATVADQLQSWFEETGIDGFNLAYTVMPESIEDFVELVVPELQRRGAYKRSYESGTMREKLFGKGPRLQAPHPGTSFRPPSANC